MKSHIVIVLLLVVGLLFTVNVLGSKRKTNNNRSRVELEKILDKKFEEIVKSDILKLSYTEQQHELQEKVKSINKLTKNHRDLHAAWQSLDRLEREVKQDYIKHNKNVIIAKAKLSKACKMVEHHKLLLKKLQTEILKHKLTYQKKVKITQKYLKIKQQLQLEMKKAYELYVSVIKIYKESRKEYIKAKKETPKQVSAIKLQLKLIDLMKKKLYSTQGLEFEVTRLFEQWERIIHEKQLEYDYSDEKCHCPVIYRPVCAKNGLTYNSACTAKCAGVDIHYTGVCKCIPQEAVIMIKESSTSTVVTK